MTIGTCKLCLQEKELIDNSHIISDFVFKPLYDGNHTLRLFDPNKHFIEGEPVKYPKSAPYSGGILCANCDNVVLSKYESYASKALYAKGPLSPKLKPQIENYIGIDGQEYSIIKNIDYRKMKLFLLSLLWRASITPHPVFNEIKLKADDEEKIRWMIYNDDPLTTSDYPIFLFSWLNDKQAKTDFVSQPLETDRGDKSWYVFPIRGIVFNFYLNIDSIAENLRPHILKEDGVMSIFYLKVGTYSDWLKRYHNIEG